MAFLRLPSSFAWDNIAKLTLINFCTRFHLYLHVYALYLQGRGLSLLEIATIETVVTASIVLLEVPTGVIADRIGHKWSIVASTFLLMCAETLFLFSQSYAAFLGVAALTGIGFAFASGATEALIYGSLSPENRESQMTKVMGMRDSVGQIAFFISPMIGAWILGNLAQERFQIAIGLTAFALLIGTGIALTLREPQSTSNAAAAAAAATSSDTPRQSSLTIFRNGVRELRNHRRLLMLTLMMVLTTPFTASLITTLAPPYLVQNQVPPFWIALSLSLGSLLSALTIRYAYVIERIFGLQRSLLLLTLLPGIGYGLLAVSVGSVPVWLLITLMYGFNDMRNPLLSAYRNTQISDGSRATILSMMGMLHNLFVSIMAPVYGGLATRSLPLAFVVMGAVIIGTTWLLRRTVTASAIMVSQ